MFGLGKHTTQCPDDFGVLWCNWAYAAAKHSQITPRQWLDAHKRVVALVLPSDALQIVLDIPDDEAIVDASDDVHKLVRACGLGEVLFGPLMRKVAQTRFRTFVSEQLKVLAQVKLLTEAAIMDWVRTASTLADKLPGAELLPASRTALIKYQSQTFSISCKSKYEELELHAMAAMRGWASAAEQIARLPGEEVLFPPAEHIKVTGKVDNSAVVRAANARREFLAIVRRDKVDQTGERVKDWTG
eukprot:3081695-Amphidinium_carterae.3